MEKAPGRADWAKLYPAHAAQAHLSGDVRMRCLASETGSLQNCAVISETPTGQGFGAAALSLANGMAVKRTTADGEPVAGRSFIIPVKFEPDVLSDGFTLTKPEWAQTPTGDAFARYLPAEAVDGRAHTLVHCSVTGRGLLDGCSLLEESPKGHGYGEAALKLAALFMMRPMTIDGRPVAGATVDVPINFIGRLPRDFDYDPDEVILDPPWVAAPSRAELAAAIPGAAIGRNITARVVLRCGLRRDGSLEACTRVSEAPMGQGFERAAQALANKFRLPPESKSDPYGFRKVDVPFVFSDPSHPTQPPVDLKDPMWIRGIDPASLIKSFPAAALKAGLTTGRSNVACRIVADGTLTACAVISEDPPGFGFGDAAKIIAGAMRMSPWSKLGEPVEGGRVILPIRMVLPPAPSGSAPPSEPAKSPLKPPSGGLPG